MATFDLLDNPHDAFLSIDKQKKTSCDFDQKRDFAGLFFRI